MGAVEDGEGKREPVRRAADGMAGRVRSRLYSHFLALWRLAAWWGELISAVCRLRDCSFCERARRCFCGRRYRELIRRPCRGSTSERPKVESRTREDSGAHVQFLETPGYIVCIIVCLRNRRGGMVELT